MISYSLNSNLVQILCAAVVLQSMITTVANSLSIKHFHGPSTSSYLCFPISARYFNVFIHKALRYKSSSIGFSINHSIPSLYYIVSTPFFIRFFAHINHIYKCIPQKFQNFNFFVISFYYINTLFTETSFS